MSEYNNNDNIQVEQTGLIDGYEKPKPAGAYGGRTNAITRKDLATGGLTSDQVSNRIIFGIGKIMEIKAKANKRDPESLMRCLEEYLQFCIENSIKISNSSAMAACGVDRREIDQWASGERKANDGRYAYFANTLREICRQYREGMMVEGKLNPIVGIWWQKTYDGFRDDMSSSAIQLHDTEDMTAQEIAEKYADIPDD